MILLWKDKVPVYHVFPLSVSFSLSVLAFQRKNQDFCGSCSADSASGQETRMFPGDTPFPLGIRHVRMYAALVALRRQPFSSWKRQKYSRVHQHRMKLLLLCAVSIFYSPKHPQCDPKWTRYITESVFLVRSAFLWEHPGCFSSLGEDNLSSCCTTDPLIRSHGMTENQTTVAPRSSLSWE